MSHHPLAGAGVTSLHSQPGAGSSLLPSTWPQVVAPDGGHESHRSRVRVQRCTCVPAQARGISPPRRHSERAAGAGGRRGLGQPRSGVAAWGQSQKQVWGGSRRGINRPQNIPRRWRQRRQPGLKLSQRCPAPGAWSRAHRPLGTAAETRWRTHGRGSANWSRWWPVVGAGLELAAPRRSIQ